MRSFYNSPMPPLRSPLSFDDVAAAHERIRAQAKRTPVLSSSTVDALTGARVFFKCENFQRMGAFKFRGAYNALAQLSPEEKHRGVIAFSSGNHAQAVALAGKILNVKTLIVMPANAPQVKLDATRGYGAEVVLYQKDEKREEVTATLAKERNLSLIPPFDHPHVIAGQGTAAKELRSEEHTSELQSPVHIVCRLLLEKKKNKTNTNHIIKKKIKKKTKKK